MPLTVRTQNPIHVLYAYYEYCPAAAISVQASNLETAYLTNRAKPGLIKPQGTPDSRFDVIGYSYLSPFDDASICTVWQHFLVEHAACLSSSYRFKHSRSHDLMSSRCC